MKRILVSLIFIVCAVGLYAQNITGKVVDKNNVPVAYANVLLLKADSTYLAGTITNENGIFSIQKQANAKFINISFIGYHTILTNIDRDDLGILKLKENDIMLKEVVIKGELPMVKFVGDEMQTNVSGSVLEKLQTMEQLLENIPNVVVQNGKIEVFGRGTPEIYINGRKMINKMELERLQPDDIKNISVITNPGARYAANVRSVIRITTKKLKGEGFGGDMKLTSRINEVGRMSWIENSRFNYRKGGLDLSTQIYGAHTRQQDDKQLVQNTLLTDTWVQDNNITQEYSNKNIYGNIAASYMFNESNSVGTSLDFDRYIQSKGVGDMSTITLCNDIVSGQSSSNLYSPASSSALSVNTYYVGKLNKLGIDFNADYYKHDKNEQMYTNSKYTIANTNESHVESVNTDRRTNNMLVSSKLILSYPLFKGELSLGGEYSYSRRNSNYNVLPIGIVDNENSKINEVMESMFVDYIHSFGKLNTQIGLRYESTNFKYYDKGAYQDKQSKIYNEWFPSIAMAWPVGKTQMQLTFATDINRPSYHSLREGIQYDNKYTYESGNPFLVPSITRNFGYAVAWKWLNFNVQYSHIKDDICNIMKPYNNNPSICMMRPENMDNYDRVNLSLSISPTFGIWKPSLSANISKQWFTFENVDGNTLNRAMGSFRLNNIIDTKWLTASLQINLQTKGNMGNMYISKGVFYTNISLSKSMFKNKFVVDLYVYDIFGTADNDVTIYSGKQNVAYFTQYSATTISLSARYKFNSNSRKYRGSGSGSSQKERM